MPARALRLLLLLLLPGIVVVAAQPQRALDQTAGKPVEVHASFTAATSPRGAAPFTFALPVNAAELTPASLDQAVLAAKAAGAAQIDSGAPWWYVMPAPGTYNWSFLDRLVSAARFAGLTVSLEISGTPDWAHPDLAGTLTDPMQRIWYPPRGPAQLAAWSGYVTAVAQRYGTDLRQVVIWNEPNVTQSWEPSPSPAEYALVLRAAYAAAKQANPAIDVAFGGLSRNDVGFLSAYYSAAATMPAAAGSRTFFDTLDVHPYSDDHSPDYIADAYQGAFGTVVPTFLGLAAMEQVLVSHGDGNKPIFVGEYGFSTSATWMPALPDATRALYAKRALAIASSLPYVSGLAWYGFIPNSTDGPEWSIMSAAYRPSATYLALQQAMQDGPTRTFLDVPALPAPLRGTITLTGSYTGSPAEPIVTTVAYVDGQLVASAQGVAVHIDTRTLTNGSHALMLAGYTAGGSVFPSTAVPISVQNAAATVGVQSLSLSGPLPGGRVSVQATVAATSPMAVGDLVVAVREGPAGANVDFPGVAGVALGPTPSTFAFTATFPSGTYRYWVAYEVSGTWHDLAPVATFRVA